MFDRLLVPLDGSSLAEAALVPSEAIARAFGSTVVLLHIIERRAPTTVHGEPHLSDPEPAAGYLEEIQHQLLARGIVATLHVHDAPEGDVAKSIAAHVDEEGADLVVLCTHGRGGVRRLLFGQIAQQVLQHGAGTILLVRPPAEGGTPAAFAPRRILVALDGAPAAEAALAPASALAHRFGAALHLVMVVATPGTVRGGRSAAATLLPSATRALLEVEQAQAQDYLEGLARPLRGQGLPVDVDVRRGAVTGQLLDDALEHKIGLVVAATHGRAGLQAAWSGSVAARLAAQTTAPVLLLRRVDKET